MDRKYIELDSAIKHLRGECVTKYPISFSNGISAAANALGKLPAADVVEVVRCKDCSHGSPDDDGSISCSCFVVDGMSPDGYCSFGERKDQNG